MMNVGDRLRSGEILILDGAIGTEIARLGADMHSSAWCGVANKTHPQIVREVHEKYLKAGADVITANTFTTCRHTLAGAGLEEESNALTRRGVELAREAIDNISLDREVLIAGSMSNMVSFIPGSASPDPRFVPSEEEESANYFEMAESLKKAGADVILLEMMIRIPSACRLAKAALSVGLPVWIGMSCCLTQDRKLAAWDMHIAEPQLLDSSDKGGEIEPLNPLIEAMAAFKPQVMGIMHSDVDAIGPGTEALKEKWSGPLMGYPEAEGEHKVSPDVFADRVSKLVNQGVQIVGGCCGTTIEHIQAMVNLLKPQS